MTMDVLHVAIAAKIMLWTAAMFSVPLALANQTEKAPLWRNCQQSAENVYQETKKNPKGVSINFYTDYQRFAPGPYFIKRSKISNTYSYRGYLHYIDHRVGLISFNRLFSKYANLEPANQCVACCAWKIDSKKYTDVMQGICRWYAGDVLSDQSKIWFLNGYITDRTTLRGNYCFDRMAPALATGRLSHGEKLNPKREIDFPGLEKN